MAEEAQGTSGSGDFEAAEEQNVVSMVDVLHENQELEAEATAVLGDSDDKFCTYPQGCLARQALYACATCSSAPNPRAGVCLACSYECHEGHQLFELYTKRNFRCDCGNSNFPEFTCKLEPKKAATNPDNKYNDNFRGLYCICNRPYPDPEDEVEDEMIQCVVCEDWYHGRHLGSVKVPENEDYQEMICTGCMKKCDFLWAYSVRSQATKIVKEETTESVDIEGNTESAVTQDKKEVKDSAQPTSTNSHESEKTTDPVITKDTKDNNGAAASSAHTLTDENTPAKPSQNATGTSSGDVDKTVNTNSSSTPDQSKTDLSNGETCSTATQNPNESAVISAKIELAKDEKTNTNTANNGDVLKEDSSNIVGNCKLKDLQSRGVYKGDHASFWPEGWRNKLCTCENCKSMYAEKLVAFLTDETESVSAYEKRGLNRQSSSASQYEQGMEALSSMDRVQQVEMLHGFNDLKSELTNYLKDFADQGKVVKREDIDKFFDDMQSRKRQRVGEPGSAMQYHCR